MGDVGLEDEALSFALLAYVPEDLATPETVDDETVTDANPEADLLSTTAELGREPWLVPKAEVGAGAVSDPLAGASGVVSEENSKFETGVTDVGLAGSVGPEVGPDSPTVVEAGAAGSELEAPSGAGKLTSTPA